MQAGEQASSGVGVERAVAEADLAERTFLQVSEIRRALREEVKPERWAPVHPDHKASAENLCYYVELRKRDLRDLQQSLSLLGLSSLGRSEAHVLGTLDAVNYALCKMTDCPGVNAPNSRAMMQANREELARNLDALLGPSSDPRRRTRIMVTLPSEAIHEQIRIIEILDAGAEILRINTAHDDEVGWRKMAETARRHESKLGRPVVIAVDLAGPKLRVEELRDAAGKTKRKIKVAVGDHIRAVSDANEFAQKPEQAEFLVSEPAVFDAVRAGDRIFIDDGLVGGLITRVDGGASVGGAFEVEITATEPEGGKIALEKGVNLPDTSLNLPALSPDDFAALDFIADCADIVSLSFVKTPEDIEVLFDELRKRDATHLGVVLKIELVEAFQNLPSLLLKLLEWERGGVMVARGDLAVEAGYLRLAELQEEVLWLCESAHVPVIWATEVLNQMSKTGHPSRAEVTDAAMSSRAECVMLNKGKYIADSIRFLNTMLARMEEHQNKKQSLLRQLRSWG